MVDGIKQMIADGRLRAGARLPIEKQLALQLSVSRSSLREGVRALCIMGVLETRQGDGTYVTSLEPSILLAPMSFLVDLHADADVSSLQSVRRVLETEAAGRAALIIGKEALAQAAAILDRASLTSVDGDPDYEAHLEADIDFHRVVAGACGNPALEALIEALAPRTVRGRMWRAITEEGALAAARAEHRAILQALAEHDPDRARLRMGAHLLAVEDFMHAHAPDVASPPGDSSGAD